MPDNTQVHKSAVGRYAEQNHNPPVVFAATKCSRPLSRSHLDTIERRGFRDYR